MLQSLGVVIQIGLSQMLKHVLVKTIEIFSQLPALLLVQRRTETAYDLHGLANQQAFLGYLSAQHGTLSLSQAIQHTFEKHLNQTVWAGLDKLSLSIDLLILSER